MMAMLHTLSLILLLAALLSPNGGWAQTINWTKYDNTIPANSDGTSTNGKIPLGTVGKGDSNNVSSASVLKDGSTYKMWYAGQAVGAYRIYYATSPDGLTWTKYDNTVPADSDGTSTNGRIPLGNAGKGDTLNAQLPFVLKDGSIYKMWYTGWGGTPGGYRIYYATSTNGLTWSKYNNTVPADSDGSSTAGRIPRGGSGRGDDTYVYAQSVLKDGATYKMWYTGHDGGTNRIYYATSSNGLEWTKLDNGIPDNSNGSSTNGKIPLGTSGTGDDVGAIGPFVLKDGSTYKMWYAGFDGANYRLYYAYSSNGLEWTKLDNSVPANSDTTNSNSRLGLGTDTRGDDYHAAYPSVVLREDGRMYQLWYSGNESNVWRIYHATQPPSAGTIFTFK